MTSRFGRNKRRRARELIAQQQTAIERQRATINHESMKAHRLAVELEDIRDMVGFSRSILFPPKPQPINTGLHCDELVQLAVEQDDAPEISNSIEEWRMTQRCVDLTTILASARLDTFRDCIHAYVRFRDGEVAYAISRKVLDQVEAGGIELLVRRNIAPLLARQLVAEFGKLRRKW